MPGHDPQPSRPSRLWIIIVAVCLLQVMVWVAWLALAARHPVEEVPLTTAPIHR